MKRILAFLPRLILTAVTLVALTEQSLGTDEVKPTREALLGELLDAKPTTATPKFHDVPDSYHINDKEDVLKGLIDEAKKRKLTLRGVSILGPLPGDPLWTSYVIVVLQEGEKLRVNSLVMPHARITGKSTGLISEEQHKKWMDGVSETKLLKKGTEKAPGTEKKQGEITPFDSELLLVTWSADGKTKEIHHGKVSEDGEKLLKHYNAVLKELKKTYPPPND